ncbi:MAG: gliding motility-associated C-terminal domain-containing protein [Bacteroidetes bacterium]|nr:MAG: gliding motility-associated C-terminal domain-containing protein [Bacteroidota bacterium]
MVTASNNCFSDIASVTITTITNITATLNTFPSSTICEGQQAAISVTTNSSSANYLWNTGETSSAVSVSVSGTYSVTVTDACGTVTVSESINVIPQITLTANASSSLYCPGDVITLTASGADNYLWQTGQTTASITVTSAGVFMVTGTNSCFSESLQISVTQGYVTDVSITSGDSILCSSSETIILQSVLSGNASIQWNTGETTSSISVSQPGTFYVMAVATCNTDTAFFNVYDKSVSVEVFANPASGMVPFETQLTQTSLNADAFSWMLNGNEVGTDTAYLYTMQEPGIDTVWLKASNMFGCTDSAMVTIVGETQSTVFIPNVFSPNKDGINEQFKIVFGNPSAVESVSVEIYNRWGVKIFDYQSVFGFWDGRTYSGEEAPDGTYLYVANYKLKDSEAVEVRGTVEKTGSSR